MSSDSNKQSIKYTTGMAGEFLVAGELFRHGYHAAVTYGNAKKADVVAILGDHAVRVEVKSTTQSSWVIGNDLPAESDRVWILVFLPSVEKSPEQSPEYYILTNAELLDILQPLDEKYRAKYLINHGKEFAGTGVVTLNKTVVANCKNSWDKMQMAFRNVESRA